MEIEYLIKKYENELSQLEKTNFDLTNLVGLSDDDCYSNGEISGNIEKLKEVIKDLKELNRGD